MPAATIMEGWRLLPRLSSVAMTYLAEKGVSEWLRIGRLQGIRRENGELHVPASNLQVPGISRLVHK
jgi:hypothetical protein